MIPPVTLDLVCITLTWSGTLLQNATVTFLYSLMTTLQQRCNYDIITMFMSYSIQYSQNRGIYYLDFLSFNEFSIIFLHKVEIDYEGIVATDLLNGFKSGEK